MAWLEDILIQGRPLTMPATFVRDLAPDDYAVWRQLWKQYCDFYETTLDESVTVNTWNRLLDPADNSMFARVAVVEGSVAGFAHCVVHPATWVSEPSCYLEDLYVTPECRGLGHGRALLDDLLALCRERKYARIYWHTHDHNATARKLYDTYTPADDFVRYRIVL